MKFAPAIFLVSAMFLISGCRPPGFEIGGGGSTHIPPSVITYGKATDIKLELSVWGEGSGKMSERWKAVRLHYKTDRDTQLYSIPMHLDKEEAKRIYFSCRIPPILDPNAQSITYYFDMIFDGQYNKQDEGPVPIHRNESEQGTEVK
jgi:hypothetical protein